jgi:cellulose synthase/poly-beta-1,6-N-acetylglucosamine synthase-like glycosyltransferase/tetratricopeptide (TPR) repeat protein
MQPRYRQSAILIALAICLGYLTYRLLYTLNLTTPYAIAISLFLYVGELYGVFVLCLFFLQVWDPTEPPQQPILEDRTVDVFVPTYNEDPQLLRATLEACIRLEYPHKTYVCDDGKRPAVKALAEELGVHYMIRPDNRHAKAGNLNHAFEKTDGEFIIILDADHVPEPNFITRLIGYFHDERLGFVQTPHAFYNFDSFQARLDQKNRRYWEEGHLFYEVIQPGRNRWGCPIFAGSAAMFRREALKEVGYIAVETITEDMHTGMRVNARGWKSLAISERLVAGQAAPDVTTFHSQRIRWGEGNLSIMAYDNPLTMKGLTLAQRFCYLGSMLHWAGGLFKLAIYLTPILMMFSGVAPVAEFTWTLAILTLVYIVASVKGVGIASNGFGSFFNGELFCMVNFWTQVLGTMRALFWRKFQKFIVTAKRGRQAKSIWPYVRPQLALMGISVVALAWGWGRLAYGISDDYFKPIVPTFWIVFHMVLGYIVLRRALWPEDRRFSTRHVVQLPMAYESMSVSDEETMPGGASAEAQAVGISGLGVTADLNELGVGLVAYEKLRIGEILRLRLWGRGEMVQLLGEVRWMKDFAPSNGNGTVKARAYRYGIAFRGVQSAQLDVLNRICLHYAVPRLYAEYAQGRERTWTRRIGGWIGKGLIQRRAAMRRTARFPLVLESDSLPTGPQYTVTEDVSRSGMSALLSDAVPVGSEVTFTMPTPLGAVQGKMRVLKAETKFYAARGYQNCVMEYDTFETQGRTTLEMVINRRENPWLEPALNPDRQPQPVPMTRPIGVGALSAAALVAVSILGLRPIYRDEFFLRDIAAADRVISEDEVARVEQVFTSTMRQRYPSNDRLVLLMAALNRVNRPNEIDQVTVLLAPRDRKNLDLQFALAQTLDNTKDFERAESEYQMLLREVEDQPVGATRKRGLLVGAARASVHAGNLKRAGELFHDLLKAYPNDAVIRNEFAGVLMSARELEEAARLYEGIKPDIDGRLLLVNVYAQLNNLSAAEAQCRAIAEERPDDPHAKQLLADVLSWRKDGLRQSRAIYEQLLHVKGSDPDLLLRLAQTALWSNNYNEALERYQALITGRMDQPEVVKGYVDAASSADQLSEIQRQTILKLYEQTLTGSAEDPVLLSRLAWVLQRLKEVEKSTVLLERAVALNPQDPGLRKQLVGAFAAGGRMAEALQQLEGKELDYDTRHLLVSAHLKNNDFNAATAELRRILDMRPNDRRTERLLADVLSWKKDYKQSLALFQKLAQAVPPDPEIPVRIAEVTLWSGDYNNALSLFQALLQERFDQPGLWSGWCAAAANAKSLGEPERKTAVRIADHARSEGTKDPVFLGRIAWVLHRFKETEQAAHLLERAAALPLPEPNSRKELAGVFAAFGRNKEALRLYEGLPLELEDRYRLAAIYAADKDFAAAETQCRAILSQKPDDANTVRLLADVLSWKKDYAESLSLFARLLRERPGDAELLRRRAEVTLWSGAYDKALSMMQGLMETDFAQSELWPAFVDAAAGAGQISDAQAHLASRIYEQDAVRQSRQFTLLTRLAWVMHRIKDSAKAAALIDRAAANLPDAPENRKELAGVLAAVGRNKEALKLYEGLQLTLGDRRKLVGIYSAEKDFGRAEEECRAILHEQPDDKEALRQLADVLSWRKEYRESLSIFERLIRENPGDADLVRRHAETTLWSGDCDNALPLLEQLLAQRFDQPELWTAFTDAAAGATRVTETQGRLAARIAQRVKSDEHQTAALYTRLAWILQRTKQKELVGVMLDRASATAPTDPALRKELAGVLAGAGRNKDALRMYDGLSLDAEDRRRLVALHSADKDFDSAERQCRALLQERPDDLEVLRLLASVLTWKKEYPEAITLTQRLADAEPQDTELPVRMAELSLWSGDYEKAATRFQDLLESNFDRPELWRGFVDAAAGLPQIADGQAALIRRLYDKIAQTESRDVEFLARLAWLVYRAREPAKAGILLNRALALKPRDENIRRELAGTLAAVGRARDALRMYEGMTLDMNDRYYLIGIHSTARRKCQDLLEDDDQNKEAAREAAYLAGWKKTLDESLALFEKAAQEAPKDRAVCIRFAEVTLWSGTYDRAVTLFQNLLAEQFEQQELWRSYIDAAASSETELTTRQVRLLGRIHERKANTETKVEYLSRIAWIWIRLKDVPKAEKLLDRAIALKPSEPEARKELAGVLAAAGRYDQARRMYDGLTLRLSDRFRLVEIDLAGRRFEDADKALQDIFRLKPGNLRARMLQAAMLTGRKQYAEATKLYQELAAAHPEDTTIPLKLAELSLATGDYDTALSRFQELLDKNIDQPSAWKAYIDAAAGAKVLPDSVRPVIVRVHDKLLVQSKTDAVYLTRLAWVLRRVKELDRAVAALEQALERDPESRPIRLQLAEVLYEKGAYAQAEKHFQVLLKTKPATKE